MSASKICPTCVAVAPEPTCTPVMSAVITRVKAKIPGVNAASDWSKQMELTPSEPHAFWVEVRATGAMVAGTIVVPLTLAHTESDCAITCSISFRRPAAVVLRENRHGIAPEDGAPLLGDSAQSDNVMRRDRTRRPAGNARRLTHVRDDFVEGVGARSWRAERCVKNCKRRKGLA